ncbi:MAG: hypothetical protein J1E85_02295 [Ruminococcus sp.]|nr:hypothetical protein [Ruminococcus sp.]
MKRLIMSDKYSCFYNELIDIGYQIIPTDTIVVFHTPEQKHADMQCLKIDDKYFILNECDRLKHSLNPLNPIVISHKAGKKYPENVLLNCLYLDNILYGKSSAISSEVKEYCNENNIKIVNVNQGYTRCSTLIVNEKAAITADISIAKALKNNGVEVMKISEGHIILEGFNYGFIGGASGKIDNRIVFFGNVKNHPDFNKIETFIKNHGKDIQILCPQMPLTDIGGIVEKE